MQKQLRSALLQLWGVRHYAVIAGTGWLLDNGVYIVLIYWAKIPVFYAAIMGILCGASFTYLFVTRRIFGGASWQRLAIYIVFTLFTTALWSGAVATGVYFNLHPLLSLIHI